MRFVMQVSCPLEKFNRLVAEGTAGDKIQQILEEMQPEAAYFTATDGKRGGFFVIDIDDASELPRYAEPWFLVFDAEVRVDLCMLPEDLAAAGLEELGERWSD